MRSHTHKQTLGCSGWMSTTVSVYIAETSPSHLRGRLVTLQSVLITLGRFCGALASAVAFTLEPPITGRKQPVLMMTTGLITSTKSHHRPPRFRLHWLDVLNFSSRRSVCPSIVARSLCSLSVLCRWPAPYYYIHTYSSTLSSSCMSMVECYVVCDYIPFLFSFVRE